MSDPQQAPPKAEFHIHGVDMLLNNLEWAWQRGVFAPQSLSDQFSILGNILTMQKMAGEARILLTKDAPQA